MTIETDPATGLPMARVGPNDTIVDALVRIGFAKSRREARYFIKAGAVSLGPLRCDIVERPKVAPAAGIEPASSVLEPEAPPLDHTGIGTGVRD